MTVWGRILITGAGSAAILLGAVGFQFIGGLVPCPLCIHQRWPHVIAVIIAALGVTVLARHARPLAALGTLTMLFSTVLASYHAGIEWNLWEGPDTCTSGDISQLSAEALMDQIMNAPLVRCDEIQWSLFGLTMAGWNAVISLALTAMWLASAVWAANPYESSSASQ